MSQVKKDDTVKVHYTGKLDDGKVFDSTVERGEPIKFTIGQGQIIPGFEEGVIDMKVYDKKTIIIPKEKAYGEIRKELVQEVPKSELPENVIPEIGMGLTSQTQDGQKINLVVKDVKEETIVVDGNHPLAGRDLTFELEVVEII